jgi:predicted flap endonuclease-1-like 5' DNA nuclease
MRRLAKLLGFAIGIGAVTWLVRERVLTPAPVDASPAPGFRTGPHPSDPTPGDPDSEDPHPGTTPSPDAGARGPDVGEPATGDTAADDSPAQVSEADHPDDDLTVVVGIGPAYRDRLAAAGITTLADLAAADPEHLADHVGAGAGVVADWVEQARERTT